VFATLLLQLMVTYTPFWQDLLKTRALAPPELAVTFLAASLPFAADEARKLIGRRRRV
jgi:hypothetical protein